MSDKTRRGPKGKGPGGAARPAQLRLPVTDDEKAQIQSLARLAGLPVVVWIRKQLLGGQST